MKSSFLKKFFNSKETNSKGNFNIHNVDLDDSDDLIGNNDSFFQENSSPIGKNNCKTFGNKADGIFSKKKFNIYSFNDSISSSVNEMKSPIPSKDFNFSKLKNNFSNLENEKVTRPKTNLEFTTPTSIGLNKSARDSKILQHDSSGKSNCKDLCSPTTISKGFINKIYDSNQTLKDEKFQRSPRLYKLQCSPRISMESNNTKKTFENQFLNESIKSGVKEIDCVSEKNFNDSPQKNSEDINFEKYGNQTFLKCGPESLDGIKNLISEKSPTDNNTDIDVSSGDSEDGKLKVLHLKLKLEAEKIQKWKENIENELLLKNQKLSESEKIIDSLRASNLEFQMQQENISLNFQVEIDCRSEVSKKIENSRNLCQILKQKIENIEMINKNHIEESRNLKCVQEKILHIINHLLKDIAKLSEVHLINLDKLHSKIISKDNKIQNLNDILSQLENTKRIETENYEKEIKDIRKQLQIEKDNLSHQIDEHNNLLLIKGQKEELLFSEQIKNQTLLFEKDKLLLEFSNSEISRKKSEDNNIKLLQEIEIKEEKNAVLEEKLANMEDLYSKYKESIIIEINNLNNMLNDKDKSIMCLNNVLLEKEDEINNLNDTLDKVKDDLNSKLIIKETSVESLTNTVVEKEDQITNLQILLNKSNELLKTSEDMLAEIKLENELNNKNISILKSSNCDLREELGIQAQELKKMIDELNTKKNELNQANVNLSNINDEKEKYEKVIEDLNSENAILNEELTVVKHQLIENRNKNNELEISFMNFSEINKSILKDKEDTIKNLQNDFEKLQIHKNEIELTMKNKSQELEKLSYDLNVLLEQNKVISESNEDLKALLALKENNLIVKLNEYDELEKKKQIDNEKIKNYEKRIEEIENILSENKFKISSLETFVDDLSKDKQNILKSREDLRKELMFTLEQCKNENEIIEKKKNKEIENLKSLVNSLTLDSQSISNQSKTKIIEITNQLINQKEEIAKLEKDLNTVRNEKDETKRLLELTKSSNHDFNEKMNQMEVTIIELEKSNSHLKTRASSYDNKITLLSKEIEERDATISRLYAIEMEHIELKNKLLTNSPPICTQIPDYIHQSGISTPKCQRLSSKLESLADFNIVDSNVASKKQTPQKTPKGILRQPGSASKRRKVLFEENENQTKIKIFDEESLHSDGVDIDLEDMSCISRESNLIPENIVNHISIATTPKKPNLAYKLSLSDSRSSGRLSNIRKTPSKASTKLNDRRKKDKENWFDSDNFFGVGIEA